MASSSRRSKRHITSASPRSNKRPKATISTTADTRGSVGLLNSSLTSHSATRQTRTASAARPVRPQSSDPTPEPEIYYKVKNIIGERKRTYLIDWEDDQVTGEQFKPTWEPKAFANEEAIADWERFKKTSNRQSDENPPSQGPPATRLATSTRAAPAPRELFGISRRASRTLTAVVPSDDFAPGLVSGHRTSSPIQVEIVRLPHFDPHRQYSEFVSSPLASESTRPTTAEGEPVTPLRFDPTGVIADSQSVPGSSTFLPSSPSSPHFQLPGPHAGLKTPRLRVTSCR